MRGYSKKKRWSFSLKQGVWFLLSLMIIIFFVGFTKKTVRNQEINSEIERLKSEIAQYESANSQLSEVLSYFATDDFVEEEARLKLGLKKEGEEVVVIKQTEKKLPDIVHADIPVVEQNSQKWWKYFFAH